MIEDTKLSCESNMQSCPHNTCSLEHICCNTHPVQCQLNSDSQAHIVQWCRVGRGCGARWTITLVHLTLYPTSYSSERDNFIFSIRTTLWWCMHVECIMSYQLLHWIHNNELLHDHSNTTQQNSPHNALCRRNVGTGGKPTEVYYGVVHLTSRTKIIH